MVHERHPSATRPAPPTTGTTLNVGGWEGLVCGREGWKAWHDMRGMFSACLGAGLVGPSGGLACQASFAVSTRCQSQCPDPTRIGGGHIHIEMVGTDGWEDPPLRGLAWILRNRTVHAICGSFALKVGRVPEWMYLEFGRVGYVAHPPKFPNYLTARRWLLSSVVAEIQFHIRRGCRVVIHRDPRRGDAIRLRQVLNQIRRTVVHH